MHDLIKKDFVIESGGFDCEIEVTFKPTGK